MAAANNVARKARIVGVDPQLQSQTVPWSPSKREPHRDGVCALPCPGTQVTAEIHLGTRTILKYLLLSVMSAFQDVGRERRTSP